MNTKEKHEDAPRASGLEGVVVADTRLSEVDGEKGRLTVAGHDIEVLAATHGLETTAHLLWTGKLPDAEALETTRAAFARGRAAAYALLPRLGAAIEAKDAMAGLRGAVSQLATVEATPEGGDNAWLAGATGVLAAGWLAQREKRALLEPDPKATHAVDLLRLITGKSAEPARSRALETYLVTVADHGMNASTFTARVVASTGADPISAVVAAIGALSGPLHGGAPGPVLDMLDAVGEGDATPWLERELAAGRRIMGMGHRIYRVRDPRVVVLERAANALREAGLGTPRLRVARAVEQAAEKLLAQKYPDRALKANVELATAVLLDAVGIPRELFSAMFACGRVLGWLAHVDEQRATGRLIRPDSRYIGPTN